MHAEKGQKRKKKLLEKSFEKISLENRLPVAQVKCE
jgi:hypothetical protein